MTWLWILVAVFALVAAAGAIALWRMGDPDRGDTAARIDDLCNDTTTDTSGAVRSIQSAVVSLTPEALEDIWSPMHLERLARTYWRFLTRATLGLVHVDYTERERFVVLLARPLKLLTFRAPEYEMNAERGIVRWRIERGLLVAKRGCEGNGYLQIDVTRLPNDPTDPARPARMRIEVEVANFYPAIAAGLSRWFYNLTQSRIHVFVTYGFLRSLARLDYAESRVGRLNEELHVDDVPDPPPIGQRAGGPRKALPVESR
jgi:hypothetical protein